MGARHRLESSVDKPEMGHERRSSTNAFPPRLQALRVNTTNLKAFSPSSANNDSQVLAIVCKTCCRVAEAWQYECTKRHLFVRLAICNTRTTDLLTSGKSSGVPRQSTCSPRRPTSSALWKSTLAKQLKLATAFWRSFTERPVSRL